MRSHTAPVAAEGRIRSALGSDRAWNAYALADLSPPWRDQAEWMLEGESLLLIYHGLTPPVLFASGEPQELSVLFKKLPPGSYWYTLRPTDFELVRHRASSQTRMRMWRMILADRTMIATTRNTVRLDISDQGRIEMLFGEHPNQPDAYHPAQIESGAYFGVFDGDALVSVAGTHVLDAQSSVAAVGNVFTSPEWRRRGFGTATSAAVVAHLVELGIETIVLNVEMANEPAIEMYRKLGFMPYCGFYEGIFELV